MTTETAPVHTSSKILLDNECLMTGHVVEPFIKDGILAGAILSFDNYRETALLHIRQVNGESQESRMARLADLSIGAPLLVRIIIQTDAGKRSVWASEKGVAELLLVEAFAKDPDAFRDIEGVVQGVTKWGHFVDLQSGPAQGQRALLRLSSLSGPHAGGRVKLGAFVQFKPGDAVVASLAEARFDDEQKLLLRLENMRPRTAA